MQGEIQLLGQIFDALLQLAGFERRQLVEQREDGDRVDGDHEDLEAGSKQPEVVEELVARLLNDGQERRQDGRGENESQQVRLDQIGDE